MDKIFSGIDRAKELGFSTYRDYLTGLGIKFGHRWNGKANDITLEARVDFGRWLADCKCGAAQYVEPGEPFYCAECGMEWNDNLGCQVIFPDDKAAIEKELMNRPVKEVVQETQSTIQAPPVEEDLSRSWVPKETVPELKEQRRRRSKK